MLTIAAMLVAIMGLANCAGSARSGACNLPDNADYACGVINAGTQGN
jgi:hypothetical protein